MRFYTNVQMIGNNFLVRGYEDGRKVMFQEKYNPTLFVKSRKETKWKTLEGEYVEPIQPGLVRDCRDFIKKYDGVEGFKVFGNERYQYQYISDKYPEEEIKFDINKVGLVTMDIEVQSEEGFLVLTHVLKRCYPSRFKTMRPKRLPLGVVIPILPHRRM